MILSIPHHASAASSFFEDFEAGVRPTAFSGTSSSVVGTEGFSAYGFGNYLIWNIAPTPPLPGPATVFSVSGLDPHSAMDLAFDLAIINSWDGNQPGSEGAPEVGDHLVVRVDGVIVFDETFTVFPSTRTQTYTGPALTPLERLFVGGGAPREDIGYRIAISGIPHTSSSLVVEWFATGNHWTGEGDESFALDNVSVRAVPEPATALLVLGGLVIPFLRRRTAA